MSKSLKNVYIPNPCSQSWDEMTAAEGGRFCGQCDKVVFDFTNRPAEEFFALYKEKKGKICVSFYEDQINQDLRYTGKSKRPIRQWVYSAFLFGFLELLSLPSAAGTVLAREKVEQVSRLQIEGDSVFVKGKVSNQHGTEVGDVDIVVKDEAGKVLGSGKSGSDGCFRIYIGNESPPPVQLEWSKKSERHTHFYEISHYRYSKENKLVNSDLKTTFLALTINVDIKNKKNHFRKIFIRRIGGTPAHFW